MDLEQTVLASCCEWSIDSTMPIRNSSLLIDPVQEARGRLQDKERRCWRLGVRPEHTEMVSAVGRGENRGLLQYLLFKHAAKGRRGLRP